MLTKNRTLILLLIVLVLGGMLRLYRLGSPFIWNDEMFSIATSRMSFVEIVKTKYFFRDENSIHPPLYELFLHTVAILHPESFEQDYPKEEDNRFWLRILPAMFGILCIPLTYWVGLRLAGKWEGLVAATLTAFSVFHIFYSQECRPYILMSVWTLIAFGCYFEIFRRAELKWAIGLAIACTLGAYTHYFFLFVPIIICVSGLIWIGLAAGKKQIAPGRLMIRLMQAGILFVLLYSPWIQAIRIFMSYKTGGPVTGDRLALSFRLIYEIAKRFAVSLDPMSAVFIGLTAIGLLALIKHPARFVLLVMWIALPYVILSRVVIQHNIEIRYFIFQQPAVLFLTAVGICCAGRMVARIFNRVAGDVRWIGNGLGMLVSILLLVGFIAGNAVRYPAYYAYESRCGWMDFDPFCRQVILYNSDYDEGILKRKTIRPRRLHELGESRTESRLPTP